MKHYIVVIVDPDVDENAVNREHAPVRSHLGTPQIVVFITVLFTLTCFCLTSVRNVVPRRLMATPTVTSDARVVSIMTPTATLTPDNLICTCVTPVPTATPACFQYIELIMTRMPDLLTPLPEHP